MQHTRLTTNYFWRQETSKLSNTDHENNCDEHKSESTDFSEVFKTNVCTGANKKARFIPGKYSVASCLYNVK